MSSDCSGSKHRIQEIRERSAQGAVLLKLTPPQRINPAPDSHFSPHSPPPPQRGALGSRALLPAPAGPRPHTEPRREPPRAPCPSRPPLTPGAAGSVQPRSFFLSPLPARGLGCAEHTAALQTDPFTPGRPVPSPRAELTAGGLRAGAPRRSAAAQRPGRERRPRGERRN